MNNGTVKWFTRKKAMASSLLRTAKCIRTFLRDHRRGIQDSDEGQSVTFDIVEGPPANRLQT